VIDTGVIEPLKKVEVKSKVAGRVARLLVQEGDRVRAGDVLAEIDPTEINSQVAQMRAQLDGARARLTQSHRSVTYQEAQTRGSVEQYGQAVASAEARLRSAEEDARVQPQLTASEIAQAEAGLRSAEQALEILRTSTQPQALVQARTGLDEALTASSNAERGLARQRRLLEKGFASQTAVDAAESETASTHARVAQARKKMELVAEQQRLEIDEATSRVKQAQAGVDRARAAASVIEIKRQDVVSARAALAQARAQLLTSRSGREQDRMRTDEVAQARSSVVQLENQLHEISIRQGDTRLLAGMAGVVTKRYIEQGELVTSGVSTFSNGTPVVQIADLSQMLVKMTVNEVDVYKLSVGQPVEITADGAHSGTYMGRVRKVAPASADGGAGGGNAVVKFAVEVVITHPDGRLRPGMTARCSIIMARRTSVLRLPTHAVDGAGKEATVQILTQGVKDGKPTDTFTPRKVEAGLRGDSFVEVVSGLAKGDRVKPGVYTGPKRRALNIDFGGDGK